MIAIVTSYFARQTMNEWLIAFALIAFSILPVSGWIALRRRRRREQEQVARAKAR